MPCLKPTGNLASDISYRQFFSFYGVYLGIDPSEKEGNGAAIEETKEP